ncbi:plastocyanin/azurin family copper-binding protein [Halopiger thermotolerans]
MLKLTGAATSTAVVAGCGGNGGNGNGGNGNGADGNETGGNGNETGGSETGGAEGIEISPDQDIRFEGVTSGWVGLQPSAIEGEENPTLILEAGENYSIGWTEGDGAAHNLQLRNDDGEVVQDYTTGDPVSDPGNDEIFEFQAQDVITLYRCEPHPQMQGEIQIQGTANDGGGNETAGNETGNETATNETATNETSGNETGNETGNQTG